MEKFQEVGCAQPLESPLYFHLLSSFWKKKLQPVRLIPFCERFAKVNILVNLLNAKISWDCNSVVYQTSVGIANPKQKPTILLCGFESNTLLSKLDCAWDLKGSHTIVCKTFSHTGDHTILSLSPNYFPPLICFWSRQVTPSIEGKKEKSSLNGQ